MVMILNNESPVMNNVICQSRCKVGYQAPKKWNKKEKIQLSHLLVFCFVSWQKNKHFAVRLSDNETLAPLLSIRTVSQSRWWEIKACSHEVCQLGEIWCHNLNQKCQTQGWYDQSIPPTFFNLLTHTRVERMGGEWSHEESKIMYPAVQ